MVKQNLIIPIGVFPQDPTRSVHISRHCETPATASAFNRVIPDLHPGQGSALRVPGEQQDAQGLRVTCITPEGQGEAVPEVSHGKGEEEESHSVAPHPGNN